MPLTRTVLRGVLPLAVFNIVGHVFSSIAIALIPVSFVHTIKALSPFFTVVLSSVILRSRYSRDVYISLVPLMIGVALACTSEIAWDLAGGLAALASALVFVVQNIFSKKVRVGLQHPRARGKGVRRAGEGALVGGSSDRQWGVPSPRLHPGRPQVFQDGMLDELNLLYYSSGASFLFLLPVWFYWDAPAALAVAPSSHLVGLVFANAVTHFGQNMFAFTIMTLVSPVTYSIASLFKRVVIIVSAILYFGTNVSLLNAIGLVLTFGGLYLYNSAREVGASGGSRASMATSAHGAGFNGTAVGSSSPSLEGSASGSVSPLRLADATGRSSNAGTGIDARPASTSAGMAATSGTKLIGTPPASSGGWHTVATRAVYGNPSGSSHASAAAVAAPSATAAAAAPASPFAAGPATTGAASFIPRRDSDLMMVYAQV